MKTIYSIKTLSIMLMGLVCVSVAATAQEGSTSNLNREMTLEREYDPSVQDANKVNTLPTVKEPEVRKIPIDYSSLTIPASPDKEVSLLPSGKILADIEYNKRRGYLNLAAGTYLNLNGDLGYHILRTDKDQLNIYFSHRSTNGEVEYLQWENEKVKAKINDNLGGLNFRHAFDKAFFKLGGKYGYSGFNYYGLPMTPSISSVFVPADKETNQVTQTIGVYTGIESKPDAIVGYLLDVDYINFGYKYGLGKPAEGPTESTIALKGDMNAVLNTNHRVGVGGSLRFLNYSQPPTVQLPVGDGGYYVTYFENRIELLLSPYYRIEGGSWNVKLGANVGYVTGFRNEWVASPNITADITVADKTVLYAAATGSIQSNSLYELSLVNRYINPTIGVQPSRTWLDVIAGVKSGIAPGFWFDVFGGYKVIADDFFFVPNRNHYVSDFGNYSNSMENIDSRLLFVGANLKYTYQKFADFYLKGVYNQWNCHLGDYWLGSSGGEVTAYGRPEMEITTGIALKPSDKITVALDYYLATGRYTTLGLTDVKFKNINELNGTASYTFNKTVAAYLKVNNVLFQQYEWYYGYPMQGFNIMAGVNLNF